MHRDMGRPSLAEAVVSETLGQNQRLERIDDAVDWERLGQVVAGVHAAPRGRPSYPPLLMVKVLLLQQWYSLSDPQLEEALGDRLSFSPLCGAGPCRTPRRTIRPSAAFVRRWRSTGSARRCLRKLAAQLDAQGLVLKQGTLLDATLVASQVRRPPLAAGRRAPPTRRRRGPSGGGAPAPTSATRCIWGWDEDTGLVRRAVLTPANVYESEVADALVSGDERAVYGDRAYESRRRRQWLRGPGDQRTGSCTAPTSISRPSPPGSSDATPSSRRAGRWWRKVFGTLKRSYGYQRVRYRGLGATPWSLWFQAHGLQTCAKRTLWPGPRADRGTSAPRAGSRGTGSRAGPTDRSPRRPPGVADAPPHALHPQLFKGLRTRESRHRPTRNRAGLSSDIHEQSGRQGAPGPAYPVQAPNRQRVV